MQNAKYLPQLYGQSATAAVTPAHHSTVLCTSFVDLNRRRAIMDDLLVLQVLEQEAVKEHPEPQSNWKAHRQMIAVFVVSGVLLTVLCFRAGLDGGAADPVCTAQATIARHTTSWSASGARVGPNDAVQPSADIDRAMNLSSWQESLSGQAPSIIPVLEISLTPRAVEQAPWALASGLRPFLDLHADELLLFCISLTDGSDAAIAKLGENCPADLTSSSQRATVLNSAKFGADAAAMAELGVMVRRLGCAAQGVLPVTHRHRLILDLECESTLADRWWSGGEDGGSYSGEEDGEEREERMTAVEVERAIRRMKARSRARRATTHAYEEQEEREEEEEAAAAALSTMQPNWGDWSSLTGIGTLPSTPPGPQSAPQHHRYDAESSTGGEDDEDAGGQSEEAAEAHRGVPATEPAAGQQGWRAEAEELRQRSKQRAREPILLQRRAGLGRTAAAAPAGAKASREEDDEAAARRWRALAAGLATGSDQGEEQEAAAWVESGIGDGGDCRRLSPLAEHYLVLPCGSSGVVAQSGMLAGIPWAAEGGSDEWDGSTWAVRALGRLGLSYALADLSDILSRGSDPGEAVSSLYAEGTLTDSKDGSVLRASVNSRSGAGDTPSSGVDGASKPAALLTCKPAGSACPCNVGYAARVARALAASQFPLISSPASLADRWVEIDGPFLQLPDVGYYSPHRSTGFVDTGKLARECGALERSAVRAGVGARANGVVLRLHSLEDLVTYAALPGHLAEGTSGRATAAQEAVWGRGSVHAIRARTLGRVVGRCVARLQRRYGVRVTVATNELVVTPRLCSVQIPRETVHDVFAPAPPHSAVTGDAAAAASAGLTSLCSPGNPASLAALLRARYEEVLARVPADGLLVGTSGTWSPRAGYVSWSLSGDAAGQAVLAAAVEAAVRSFRPWRAAARLPTARRVAPASSLRDRAFDCDLPEDTAELGPAEPPASTNASLAVVLESAVESLLEGLGLGSSSYEADWVGLRCGSAGRPARAMRGDAVGANGVVSDTGSAAPRGLHALGAAERHETRTVLIDVPSVPAPVIPQSPWMGSPLPWTRDAAATASDATASLSGVYGGVSMAATAANAIKAAEPGSLKPGSVIHPYAAGWTVLTNATSASLRIVTPLQPGQPLLTSPLSSLLDPEQWDAAGGWETVEGEQASAPGGRGDAAERTHRRSTGSGIRPPHPRRGSVGATKSYHSAHPLPAAMLVQAGAAALPAGAGSLVPTAGHLAGASRLVSARRGVARIDVFGRTRGWGLALAYPEQWGRRIATARAAGIWGIIATVSWDPAAAWPSLDHVQPLPGGPALPRMASQLRNASAAPGGGSRGDIAWSSPHDSHPDPFRPSRWNGFSAFVASSSLRLFRDLAAVLPSAPNEPPFAAPGPATLFGADAVVVASARRSSAAQLGDCNADAGAAALLASADLWAALESFTGSEEQYSETRWAMLPNVDDVSWNALLRFQWTELVDATGRAKAAAQRLLRALGGVDASGCAPGSATHGGKGAATAQRAARHARAATALGRAAELALLYQGTWVCLLETTWWVRTARVISLSHGARALSIAMPLPQSVLADPDAAAGGPNDPSDAEEALLLLLQARAGNSSREAGQRGRRRSTQRHKPQHHRRSQAAAAKALPKDPELQHATGACLSWPWLRGSLDEASSPPVQRLTHEPRSRGSKPTDRACAEASRLLAAGRAAVEAWKRQYPEEGALWGVTAPATGTDARPSLFRDTAPLSARSVIEWLNGPLRWRWRALCESPTTEAGA